ncbi:hypothetical protein V6N11_021993 [Hibiscus sabdariffa]|uniref:Protein YIP n=1 Tax=Hibiscus sabdariffa TaxID=183260 RepID=A0ABR2TI98_9ROSI
MNVKYVGGKICERQSFQMARAKTVRAPEISYSLLDTDTDHLLDSVQPFFDLEDDAWYGRRSRAYQNPSPPATGLGQKPPLSCKGVFSISSYQRYFDLDTDEVMHRVISSFNPARPHFINKIDPSPDLYGFSWITTTLVFMLAAFGNCGTYLMRKHADRTSWSFDVGYVNAAAFGIYGYALVVPTAFYLLLQYRGSNPSLVRLWCMWGYSLSIFVPTALLLLIPVEIVRWIVILVAGLVSSCFVALNLRSYFGDSHDVGAMSVAAFGLQMALAILIKVWFFP